MWMVSEITKGQLLALQLGRLKDSKRLKPEHVSLAKRNNVWVARECAKLAREILGANGIVDDYPSSATCSTSSRSTPTRAPTTSTAW